MLASVAELGAEKMEATIGKASLRDGSDRNRRCRGQDACADGASAALVDSEHLDAK